MKLAFTALRYFAAVLWSVRSGGEGPTLTEPVGPIALPLDPLGSPSRLWRSSFSRCCLGNSGSFLLPWPVQYY